MGTLDPLKVPSYASMILLENSKFNHKAVKISLPNIMSYMPLAESPT